MDGRVRARLGGAGAGGVGGVRGALGRLRLPLQAPFSAELAPLGDHAPECLLYQVLGECARLGVGCGWVAVGARLLGLGLVAAFLCNSKAFDLHTG